MDFDTSLWDEIQDMPAEIWDIPDRVEWGDPMEECWLDMEFNEETK